MKRIIVLTGIFIMLSQFSAAQLKGLSLDVSWEENFILDDRSSVKKYNKPLTDKSTDLSFRLDWNVTNVFGLWGQIAMVFGHGSKVDAAENYLDMFKEDFNLDLDNYYIKKLKFNSRVNYVPSVRVAVGSYLKVRYKRCKFIPYVGAGFQGINTVNLGYDLKEKDTNNFYEVNYAWGGTSPNTYLGFISGEMKFAYTFYPKRDLIIGFIYRRYLTRPEFKRTIKDYYREKKKETLHEVVEDGNLVSGLGISIGLNFR